MNFAKIKLYAETHAIEVVNFIVRLGISIDNSDVRRFDKETEELKQLFPAISDLLGIQIQLTPNQSQVAAPPPASNLPLAKDLAYYDTDGQPIWSGKFQDDQILVSCRKYSTWEVIWPEAKQRLNALLKCVHEYKPVYSVDYSVTDTFSANRSEQILLARNLFKDSPFLPKKTVDNPDPRWDIGQGWFETISNGNQNNSILVRVDARSWIQNDTVTASISNLHSQRFGMDTSVKDIKNSDDDTPDIEKIYAEFHEKNKKLLKQILVDELLVRMNLKETD